MISTLPFKILYYQQLRTANYLQLELKSRFYRIINYFLLRFVSQCFAQFQPYSLAKEPVGTYSLLLELQIV